MKFVTSDYIVDRTTYANLGFHGWNTDRQTDKQRRLQRQLSLARS